MAVYYRLDTLIVCSTFNITLTGMILLDTKLYNTCIQQICIMSAIIEMQIEIYWPINCTM